MTVYNPIAALVIVGVFTFLIVLLIPGPFISPIAEEDNAEERDAK